MTKYSQTVLMTGGYGCIGAESVKWLLTNSSANVVVGSRQVSSSRTSRVFGDIDHSRLECVPLDVRDQSQLQQILAENEITHVVHLAALQTPDCNAHRDLGLQINLAGTQNLIEAMKTNSGKIQRFIFASSAAVYGPRASYPPGKVAMLAEPQPVNVYGAWKLAGESISKFYCEDTGVPTISLRPGVLFGPGRDAGLTASPTTAMKCVALGLPYEIPFRSRQDYLYAPDVGAAVGNALLEPFEGYSAFTLPNHTVDTAAMVDAIRQTAEDVGMGSQFNITLGTSEVPFICDLDFAPFLQAFPKVPHTTLAEAVRQSLTVFQDQVRRGVLIKDDVC